MTKSKQSGWQCASLLFQNNFVLKNILQLGLFKDNIFLVFVFTESFHKTIINETCCVLLGILISHSLKTFFSLSLSLCIQLYKQLQSYFITCYNSSLSFSLTLWYYLYYRSHCRYRFRSRFRSRSRFVSGAFGWEMTNAWCSTSYSLEVAATSRDDVITMSTL